MKILLKKAPYTVLEIGTGSLAVRLNVKTGIYIGDTVDVYVGRTGLMVIRNTLEPGIIKGSWVLISTKQRVFNFMGPAITLKPGAGVVAGDLFREYKQDDMILLERA